MIYFWYYFYVGTLKTFSATGRNNRATTRNTTANMRACKRNETFIFYCSSEELWPRGWLHSLHYYCWLVVRVAAAAFTFNCRATRYEIPINLYIIHGGQGNNIIYCCIIDSFIARLCLSRAHAYYQCQ